MINKLAVYITDFALEEGVQDKREICIYGAETALYSLISTLWLLFIGLLFGMPGQTLIIVSVFYVCQTFGGGKHAKTRAGCIGTMSVFLCAGLLLAKIGLPACVCFIIAFFSAAYLFFNPLILHSNKRYLETRKDYLTVRSRFITSAMLILLVIIACFFRDALCSFSTGLFFSAGSRLWAVLEQRSVFRQAQ